MGSLELKSIEIRYGRETIIRDFSLRVEDKELVSVLGPSGTGKTTLLKSIAGFIRPYHGDILVNGVSVLHIPPEKRDIVMVFQKPLLFPFLTVAENIAFGLKMKKKIGPNERKKIKDIMILTRLEGLGDRKTHEISGGQQQRVSLARALVLEPSILLMDEPLSNLDANLRSEMRDLVRDILSETGATTLFVTHDQSEALMISDKVALVLSGKMRQFGEPRQLFHYPKDPETARFFGGVNFIPAKVMDGFIQTEPLLPSFRFKAAKGVSNGVSGFLYFRPENAVLKRKDTGGISCNVEKTIFEGSMIRMNLKTPLGTFEALSTDNGFHRGEALFLHVSEGDIRFFPENMADK